MRIILIFTYFLICFLKAQSQQFYSIRGLVADSVTKNRLTGSSVIINEKGAITGQNGDFVIAVEKGNCKLTVSYVGYEIYKKYFSLQQDTVLNILLTPTTFKLNEAVVNYNRNDNVNNVVPGMVELTGKEIKMLPAMMGEHDPLRALQYMPGVKTVTDGDMGIYVRGGGPDQNLILFDNAAIYNPTHVAGFFSVFNEDIIENVKFYKSGIPAKYGNKLSSVIDIQSPSSIPDSKSLRGSLGLISSKVMVSSPFLNYQGGIYLSFRKSYIDEIIKPVVNQFLNNTSSVYNNSGYSFYDINLKLLYNLGKRDKVELSVYQGRDDFYMKKLSVDYKNDFFWGNRAASLNWTHYLKNDAYFVNNLYYTNYNFQFAASQSTSDIEIYSGVEDFAYNLDFVKITGSGRKKKAGIAYQHHLFRPNNFAAAINNYDLIFSPNKSLYSHELSLYYTGEYSLTEDLFTESGIRLTGFAYTGPFDKYLKNAIGEISDTIHYSRNEWMGSYYFAEPHLTFRYRLNPVSSIKFSYQYNSQYVHLLSATAVTIPLDIWMPSYENLKPQKGWQLTLGYFRDLNDKHFIAHADAYYKKMYNQVELLRGIVNSYADNLFEESMVFGMGRSYGIEFFVQKTKGSLTGWMGYTLSRSEKKFDEIEEGMIYPAKYDRKHDIKVVSSYTLNKKWSVDGSFVFSSGNAMTLPIQKCLIEGNIINIYGETNSFRMPAYHRLDISFTYKARKTEKYESLWIFSVFNVYNRQNPFYIFFEVSGDLENYTLKTEAKQVSIFPILPSLSWNFKF